MQIHVVVKDGGHRIKARRFVRDDKPIHQRSFRITILNVVSFLGMRMLGVLCIYYLYNYYGIVSDFCL